jgi:hypothetical protein
MGDIKHKALIFLIIIASFCGGLFFGKYNYGQTQKEQVATVGFPEKQLLKTTEGVNSKKDDHNDQNADQLNEKKECDQATLRQSQLTNILQESDDVELKIMAIQSIYPQLDDNKTLEVLKDALKDEDFGVRFNAIQQMTLTEQKDSDQLFYMDAVKSALLSEPTGEIMVSLMDYVSTYTTVDEFIDIAKTTLEKRSNISPSFFAIMSMHLSIEGLEKTEIESLITNSFAYQNMNYEDQEKAIKSIGESVVELD